MEINDENIPPKRKKGFKRKIYKHERIKKARLEGTAYINYANKSIPSVPTAFRLQICKRKVSTPCHSHVKTILYKNNIMTKDMAYGQQNESVARILFAEKMKRSVRSACLFIDEEFCLLAASPDGVIEEENAIVEIKCFPSLARNNEDMLSAAKNRKNLPLFSRLPLSLKINKKHNYYYQILGQLRIAQKTKCYFIGYIAPTFDLTILEIDRDENFINTMLPKLIKFYKNSVLPEIILRRGKCKLRIPLNPGTGLLNGYVGLHGQSYVYPLKPPGESLHILASLVLSHPPNTLY